MTTAHGGDKSMAALLSNSADIALIGPETAIYVLNSDSPTKIPHLLRPDRDRRLHAGGPREGRQVRLEHAQGQGDPRLPPGQHAAAVPRSGAAHERHRSAEGRQAQQQRRASRRASAPGSPGQNQYAIFIEPDAVAARARRQGAFPRLDRRDRGPCRLHLVHGDRQVHQGQSRGHPELDQRHRQGDEMDRGSADARDRARRSSRSSRASTRRR